MIPPQPPPNIAVADATGEQAASPTQRILWTLLPIVSFGLLGWVPALRIAIRTQKRAAWLWFAGLAAAPVLFVGLGDIFKARGTNLAPTWDAILGLLDMACAAGYTAVASRALTKRPTSPPMRPQPWPQPNPLPHAMPQPQPQPMPQPQAVPLPRRSGPWPPQSALDGTAAEVQAELRQLRGRLGESGRGER